MQLIKRILLVTVIAVVLTGCGGKNKQANPSGSLEATETDIASVYAGRILEVRSPLGARVHRGDTLIVLDTELLRLQRTQTEANRRSLQAQRNVAGDALRQAERNLELADTTLHRIRALTEQGSATSQQLDEAQTRRDIAFSQVSASRHQLDALSAEDAKLEAALAVYDRQLRDGCVVSPSDGTVILRNAEPGEFAAPGAVLLRLADLARLELRIFLDEQDLDRVKIGQDIPVLVDALKNESLTGKVIWVSSEAEFTPKNAQTRQARTQLVYAVKIGIANPDGRLHIGMPAEVQL